MVQNTNIMAPCLNGYAFASWSIAACFILVLLRPLRYLQFASDLIRVFLSQEKKRKWGSSKQWRSRRLERGMGKWLLLSLFLTIDAAERRRPAPDAMNVDTVAQFICHGFCLLFKLSSRQENETMKH